MATVKKPTDGVVRTQVQPTVNKQTAFKPKTSIRVHGSGNFIMITEYSEATSSTKKKIGKSDYLHKAVKSGVPVWIDGQRLSKVQLGSVIKAINTVDGVKKEVVMRNGRPMILVRKK